MKQYLVGGVIALGFVLVMGAGYLPRDFNGAPIDTFAPTRFVLYSSTSADYSQWATENIAKIKIKGSAAWRLCVNNKTDTCLPVAQNTEYEFAIHPGVERYIFDINSSATRTTFTIQEQ